jgi:hypothetical protein
VSPADRSRAFSLSRSRVTGRADFGIADALRRAFAPPGSGHEQEEERS